MTWFVAVWAGVLGAAIGSFLNAAIHRVPRGQSLLRPASACPSCGTPIRSRDNIPIVSFIALRGRCRHCRSRISVRYPLVEAATAALAVAAVVRFELSEDAAFVAVAGGVLVALAVIDLEHRRIPNVIVLPATAGVAVWIVFYAAIRGQWQITMNAFASAVAGFTLLFIMAVATGGIGFGDVKLVAFVGLATGRFGWEAFVLALFAAFVAGGVVAGVLLATRRRGRKDALPFGPSLAAGGFLGMFAGVGPVRSWLGF